MGLSYPPKNRGHSPQFSAHVYCGQTAGWIKMRLGTKVGLDPGHIVLHADQAHAPEGAQPPNFGRCLLWPNGRPSQLLLYTCFFRPPSFRRPWADFQKTLPHDAVCPEIVYLLRGEKPQGPTLYHCAIMPCNQPTDRDAVWFLASGGPNKAAAMRSYVKLL